MSYFMTTSGEYVPLAGLEPAELVPFRDAQQYLRDLEPQLSALDGSPLFLVHDGESGTSHDLVWEAEEQLHLEGCLEETALFRVLERLVAAGNTVRLWWADDGPLPPSLSECHSLAGFIAAVRAQVHAHQDLSIRCSHHPLPNNPARSVVG